MDDVVVKDEAVEFHGLRRHQHRTRRERKPGSISGFEEWTFGDDGLVAGSQGHYDQAEYDRQLEHGMPEPG